jgi:HK97 family phage major capsid protein
MSLSRFVPMKTSKKTISVLDKVQAYFVGEGQKIGTTDGNFRPVVLEAKKLAVIIPFSRELVNESIANVIEEIKPQIVEQFYRKFDDEAINGTGGVFAKSLLSVVNGTGQKVAIGATAGQNLHEDISDVMALVEDKGYDVNGYLTYNGMKNKLRKLKDTTGTPLFLPSIPGSTPDTLYGQPLAYSFGVNKATTELVTGDFRYSIVGMMGDIEYKLLEEATVGTVNLAEQDMVAIRAIMKVAYNVAHDDAFATLTPSV